MPSKKKSTTAFNSLHDFFVADFETVASHLENWGMHRFIVDVFVKKAAASLEELLRKVV